MNADSFEIERKFLIKYPDMKDKSRFSDVSEIEQTYLIPDAPGDTARVRKGERMEAIHTRTQLKDVFRICAAQNWKEKYSKRSS